MSVTFSAGSWAMAPSSSLAPVVTQRIHHLRVYDHLADVVGGCSATANP